MLDVDIRREWDLYMLYPSWQTVVALLHCAMRLLMGFLCWLN